MTKSELIEYIKANSDVALTTAQVDAVLNGFKEAVTFDVKERGNTVAITGLGTFKQKKSEARTARNPRTGESINVAAKTTIKFSLASTLK